MNTQNKYKIIKIEEIPNFLGIVRSYKLEFSNNQSKLSIVVNKSFYNRFKSKLTVGYVPDYIAIKILMGRPVEVRGKEVIVGEPTDRHGFNFDVSFSSNQINMLTTNTNIYVKCMQFDKILREYSNSSNIFKVRLYNFKCKVLEFDREVVKSYEKENVNKYYFSDAHKHIPAHDSSKSSLENFIANPLKIRPGMNPFKKVLIGFIIILTIFTLIGFIFLYLNSIGIEIHPRIPRTILSLFFIIVGISKIVSRISKN